MQSEPIRGTLVSLFVNQECILFHSRQGLAAGSNEAWESQWESRCRELNEAKPSDAVLVLHGLASLFRVVSHFPVQLSHRRGFFHPMGNRMTSRCEMRSMHHKLIMYFIFAILHLAKKKKIKGKWLHIKRWICVLSLEWRPRVKLRVLNIFSDF